MATRSGTDAAVRLLLQKTAHLHYSRLAPHAKEAIRAGFFGMDQSQDGRISLSEFLNVGTPAGGAVHHHHHEDPAMANLVPKLFRFLDTDNSGFMEFDEYITLHYLIDAGLLLCESCDSPIIMLGYTCKTCWQDQHNSAARDGARQGGGDTFDLCYNCYSQRSFSHHHDCFVDNTTMFNLLMANNDSRPHNQLVQCAVCGDFHTQGIRGALVPSHITQIHASSTKEFVCEWCSSWLCNNCGEFFAGSSSSSAPHKWLRTDLCCSSCHVHGTTTNLSSVFKLLGSTEPGQKCSSCAIKIRKGLLWSSYTRNSK